MLEVLSKSRVKNVTLIGRRKPENVAFTIKEFRELVNLENTHPELIASDFEHLPTLIPSTSFASPTNFHFHFSLALAV